MGGGNLYLEMESERAKIPNILRNDYLPVFIVKCLHEKLQPLNSPSLDSMISRRFVKGDNAFLGFEQMEDAAWTDDTLLEDNMDLEELFLLSTRDKLNEVGRILRFAKDAVECFSLNEKKLGRYFTNEFEYPCLELLYLMDVVYNLLPINAYLIWVVNPSQIKFFKEQFVAFCFSSCAFSFENRDRSNRILEHFLQNIILTHYCNPGGKTELERGKAISGDILKEITSKLMCDTSYTTNPQRHRMILEMLGIVNIPISVRKRYFTEQLNIVLSSGKQPFRSQKEILQYQEQFADPSKTVEMECFNLIIAQMITSALSSEDIIELIQSRLSTSNLNWEMLLYLITAWLQERQNRAATLLKDFIKSEIRNGLSQRMESRVANGFILARHCCLVSAEVFSRYEKWFTNLFENETYSPANERESFLFFTNILTGWTSEEPSCFLHVHVTFWPFIPKGCRSIWSDYVTLARVRLSEYKEVEDAMEYDPNPNDPVQYEVEMTVKGFETSGKVPQSILTMWIFRKQYYLKDFLPVLLRIPVANSSTDARLRLIELLNKDGKVPFDMYNKHKASIKEFV